MPQVSSAPVPYATYLRVYEPLAAFPEERRAYFEKYAERKELPTCQDELRDALAALLPTPPTVVPAQESEEAFVLRLGTGGGAGEDTAGADTGAGTGGDGHEDAAAGPLLVCPWQTRLRSWQALSRVDGQWPKAVLDAVLPPVVREQAAADHDNWMAEHPESRTWIRSANWQVPLSWFVPFGDEDRTYEKAEGDSPAVFRYRTSMAQARRRVARGYRTLKESVDDGPLLDGVLEIGRWLEDYHPKSVVELDYGGLVHVLPAADLEADCSVADVTGGLSALRAGDVVAAGLAYRRLVERWRTVRERQSAN